MLLSASLIPKMLAQTQQQGLRALQVVHGFSAISMNIGVISNLGAKGD